jgi:hypothetical protein
MRLHVLAEMLIRQSLGTRRGNQLLAFLAMVDPDDIASVVELVDTIRTRSVSDIVQDLRMLSAIDKIIQETPYDDRTDGKRP